MIRIWSSGWDREFHAKRGAPNHHEAALALLESGYKVVVYKDNVKLSDTAVCAKCDTPEEVLALEWLCPGVDDDGPLQ